MMKRTETGQDINFHEHQPDMKRVADDSYAMGCVGCDAVSVLTDRLQVLPNGLVIPASEWRGGLRGEVA